MCLLCIRRFKSNVFFTVHDSPVTKPLLNQVSKKVKSDAKVVIFASLKNGKPQIFEAYLSSIAVAIMEVLKANSIEMRDGYPPPVS